MTIFDMLRTKTSKAGRPARFTLVYAPASEPAVTMGRLEFDGQVWTFRYDDEFKRRADLRPIEGMDDREKVYRSSLLFPFFAVRIPDIDREDIKRRLEESRVTDPGQAELLRLFGRRVVSSPAFELVPA